MTAYASRPSSSRSRRRAPRARRGPPACPGSARPSRPSLRNGRTATRSARRAGATRRPIRCLARAQQPRSATPRGAREGAAARPLRPTWPTAIADDARRSARAVCPARRARRASYERRLEVQGTAVERGTRPPAGRSGGVGTDDGRLREETTQRNAERIALIEREREKEVTGPATRGVRAKEQRAEHRRLVARHATVERGEGRQHLPGRWQPRCTGERCHRVQRSARDSQSRGIAEHAQLLDVVLVPEREEAGDAAVGSTCDEIVLDRESGRAVDPGAKTRGSEHRCELAIGRDA